MTQEWNSKFNPFNSDKLFATADRWKLIQRGLPLPPPRSVSIDPINSCDLHCSYCNAEFIIDENKGSRLEKDIMYQIPDFLYNWNDGRPRTVFFDKGRFFVESVCVGGGGEPLLNKHTGKLIERLVERRIGVGIVTNGTQIDKNLESLAQCTWVGVSVDAGTRETYRELKARNKFYYVVYNIKKLVDYSKANNTNLAQEGHGHGVSFKYLLHPNNVGEVVEATRIAKEIGCRNMHIRPVSPAWFFSKEESAPHRFKPEHIETFNSQIAEAMKLEDENFGVYGVTHKFNPDFTPANDFESCYAIFMTGVIAPPSDRNKGTGKFDFISCCDRRGDDLLTVKNLTDLNQIGEFWGSPAHWKMHDAIKVRDCPRCTFSPHNKIYQEAILTNNMSYDFI